MNALVHLTHDCNLRCPYCFTGAKFSREMTLDTAKRTAEFVVDYAKQHGQPAVFSFFGGEPMMAWDALVACVWPLDQGIRTRLWAGGPVASNRFE